jgi:glycosyltransferase involved in cell wall biosynthesis
VYETKRNRPSKCDALFDICWDFHRHTARRRHPAGCYIEGLFIHIAKSVVLVSEPIKDWYEKRYYITKAYVVKNVPNVSPIMNGNVKARKLREEFDIPEEHIIFIYQGAIEESRGCSELLDIFKGVKDDVHLVLMGFGSLEDNVVSLSKTYKKIHFKKAVAMSEIPTFTSSADVGLFFLFDEPTLSYKLSFMNKFSEYMISGIPMVVSNYVLHLSEIINKHGLGWSLVPSVQHLKMFIDNVSKRDVEMLSANILDYSKNLSWNSEEKELLKGF